MYMKIAVVFIQRRNQGVAVETKAIANCVTGPSEAI